MSTKEIKDKLSHCYKTISLYSQNADKYLSRYNNDENKFFINKNIEDYQLFNLYMDGKLEEYQVIDIKTYLKMYNNIIDEMNEKIDELKHLLYEKLKLSIKN